MGFKDQLKILFAGEDTERYPMLSLPKSSIKKHRKAETLMALDVLYQLYFYGEHMGYIDFQGQTFIHPLYEWSTSPFSVVRKIDSDAPKNDRDEKIIMAFLKEHFKTKKESFHDLMVKVIVKVIEVKNVDMFYIIWRAHRTDILIIKHYYDNLPASIIQFEETAGRKNKAFCHMKTKGIDDDDEDEGEDVERGVEDEGESEGKGEGKSKGKENIFKIVYVNDGEDKNRGQYNIEPHLLLFRINPSNQKTNMKLIDSDTDNLTKLEALYSSSLLCSLKKFKIERENEKEKEMENEKPIIQMSVKKNDDDDDDGYYVFALFYRISPKATTVISFARDYPFYQVVAQTRPVKLSEIYKSSNYGNEFKVEMITGAINSSISIDDKGDMITNYKTKTDSHLLISPLHYQTTLKASPLPTLPSHDSNRQTLRWIYEMNSALVGDVKQSLVFQAGCGVFDVCPFPLATYATLPELTEEFFMNSLEKTFSVFGNPDEDDTNEEDEYHNEFLTVFFTSATNDLPYINDRLYGKSSDDMRSIRGVNSGDCDDAAIMIYQTVMYFIHYMTSLSNPILRKIQRQVHEKYIPGICVMSLASDGGDIGLHQICMLYPYDLYKQMLYSSPIQQQEAKSSVKPILLEGTSKSFSSIYYDRKGKDITKEREVIRKYASALCSVYGPNQQHSKFCSYQLDAPNMLPDNYHAYYNNLMSFSSGDPRDTSNFRCLRFTGPDRSFISEGVHYRKVLTNGDYRLVDQEFESVDPQLYKKEMIESAKCIFPVPEVNYKVTWDKFEKEKYSNIGVFSEQHLLDLIESKLSKIPKRDNKGERKSRYNNFDLDRVVFTLRRCYFDKKREELLRELENIATLCKEKNYSYSVKTITCFPTDQSIDLIVYF
jgi:hypothetical protein